MRLERALPIFFVDLRLERCAFEGRRLKRFRHRLRRFRNLARPDQHVENHAQHLDHHARLARDDRRRARLECAARHFAEELAGTELSDRLAHGQIDVGVDSDELALVRFGPFVLAVVEQKTFHSRHAAAEQTEGRTRAKMRERILNRNIDRAGNDVIRRRSELAFHADRLALAVAMQGRRAFRIFFELRAGDFFQCRQILEQLLDAERLTRT